MNTMNILESMYPRREFFDRLNHILNLQINDLKRSIEVAGANFLVAQGCMNTIEFLGGIRNGELGMESRKVKSRFIEGVYLLGDVNGVRLLSDLTKAMDAETMWGLRCGLIHQYLPKLDAVNGILIGAGTLGTRYEAIGEIERAEGGIGIKGRLVIVDLTALIKAIEAGRKKLMDELRIDESKKIRAEKALLSLPELL